MKKFLMAICCFLTLGFILTGCATVGGIKNENTELIYNGNAGVMVSDYLYYGNSYTDISSYTSMSELNTAKNVSYLARYNFNETRNAKGQNFTPIGNEKVNSEAIATDYQFMFVLGDYIYFLRPDQHRYGADDGTSSYQFAYPVLTSSKLNGDKVNAFYTFEAEVSQIEVLKYEDNYYVVALAGDRLVSIRLNNGGGSATVLAEGVTSAAIPETTRTSLKEQSSEWNGKIYYVATDEDSVTTINQINVNDANSNQTILGKDNGTVTFLYRQNDIIVYSNQNQYSQTIVYYNDVGKSTSRDDVILIDNAHSLQSSTATNIEILNGTSTTIIFDGDAGKQFKNTRGGSGVITINDSSDTAISDYTTMFVNDRLAYIITSTNIYEVDLTQVAQSARDGGDLTLTARTIVTMTKMVTSGELYSYDSGYIYYYAQLEELTEEEQEKINQEKIDAGIEVDTSGDSEDTAITDTDAGYYLYRVRINDGAYELIGTTNYEERHSDYVYKA